MNMMNSILKFSKAAPRVFSCRLFSSAITSALVKELREKTLAPMMDCKKALSDPEVDGDIGKAIDWLRKKGIARATSQASRAAREGVIALLHNETSGNVTMLEVNCETDFVSKNKSFLELVEKISLAVEKDCEGNVNIPVFLQKSFDSTTVNDVVVAAIASIRENIVIRRAVNFRSKPSQYFGCYVHRKIVEDSTFTLNSVKYSLQIGGQATIVTGSVTSELSSSLVSEVRALLYRLGMHIIASAPQFVRSSEVDSAFLAKEEQIIRELTLNPPPPPVGTIPQKTAEKPKSPEFVNKIVKGKLEKRIQEICLMSQKPVVEKTEAKSIEKFLEEFSAQTLKLPKNDVVAINGFVRWQLGDSNTETN